MEWLETAIFPVEKNLTAELVEIGTRLQQLRRVQPGLHGVICTSTLKP